MKIRIKMSRLHEMGMMFYLCVLTAHQMRNTFDQTIQIISFLTFAGLSCVYMFKKRGKLVINSFSIWYLVFSLYAFSSVLWAEYSTADVFHYTTTMIQLLATAMFLPLYVESQEDLERVLRYILIALSYAVVLLMIKTPLGDLGSSRMGSAIGVDPNVLGTRMAIGALLAYCFYMKEKKRSYVCMLILFSAVALFSGSKKALAMLVVGMGGFVLLYGENRNFKKKLKRVLLICAVLAVLMYMIFNVEPFYNVLGSRVERSLNHFLSGGTSLDNSTKVRQYYASVAVELFKENPLMGVGLNNFKSYLEQIGYSRAAYSHNNYLELLSCLGIVGTVIFYSMHLRLCVSSLSLFAHDRSAMTVFFIFMMMLYLICDYANVSYMNIFQYIMICLFYLYIRLLKKRRYA